jgi:Thiamine pyrophosphate enzyme, N-terminal TPP binding domain
MPLEPFLYAMQATDLPRPYVKWACEPARAEDVPAAIARAYYVAMQPPCGPTFVSILVDDWDRPCVPFQARQVSSAVRGDPALLSQVARVLSSAERPVMVAGASVARDDAWAARMLELSRDYEEQSAERAVEEALLADARTRQELGEKDLDRAAYLGSLKQKLIIQAQAGDVTGAETSLRVLHESLPPGDRFMSQDAPSAISQSYARMAWGALKDGQFKSAVALIDRSRSVAPFPEAVAATQARYLRYAALDEYLTASSVIDVRKVRAEIGSLNSQDSNTTKVVVPLLAHDLEARMHAATDTEIASRLQHVGREIFWGDARFKGE